MYLFNAAELLAASGPLPGQPTVLHVLQSVGQLSGSLNGFPST